MINFVHGDILQANADAIINTVNCVGIMGRGIALQFKNVFPENFRAYEAACKRNEVNPGRMFVFETGELNPRYIINFPTKRHWKGKSRIEDIESGLVDLVAVISRFQIKSIAVPPLGSGLGGLDWSDVRPLIVDALAPLQKLDVAIYEPHGAPDVAAIARNKLVPNMTPGRAALVALLQRYLNGLMDPFVTLLEAHKLMFFLQEAGEPLKLNYVKGQYGPYAETLRHALRAVEGHLISGYADGGDEPTKQLSIVPGANEDAEKFLKDSPDTLERFDRVAKLVSGFESPFGLELLATVYWVAKKEGAKTSARTEELVYAWNARKRRFSPQHIELALETLVDRQWLEADIARTQTVEKKAPPATAVNAF
ncbi:type II toxin-antitoxin system antitoxin DNA ADP-ribosyl glycohydrolase DarG [Rhizobium leguminosarum]|uniref:type II toxin-antitoxin system antitoxin DNA ADP-ribosyl glycohydrolase DarG n=1 Tax=Rhizobium leguminosarum TaxID=384 RepID=UPI0016145CA9|nr:macro domain-containing protein [Rhizobium leguminosarum]MBB4510626.1 O-acetyl-ADP-ribose deacetylase (regulator of RNase III) [Rhizobium leguminosarum]